jgi:TonB family protein
MAAPPRGERPFRFALSEGPKPLLALTRDAHLLAAVKRVTDPAHTVSVVGSEVDLSAALMTHHGGVAVLDCAALVTPVATLTERLRSQFPDLVLIVVGRSDEQGALAAQITDGSVYRFLHKPVSEQRVRLFVEAAWRRHAEGDGVLRAVRAAPPARPAGGAKRWIALAALGTLAAVVIGAALVWFATHTAQAPAQPMAASAAGTPAAGDDAALESLLTRADRALASGALVAPPEENAADLYRQALQRNAHDPRAVNGLEQVIETLLARADQQLQQQHLEAAQALVDQARALSPHHPRVAFLAAQIGAQRGRAALGKPRAAATTATTTAAAESLPAPAVPGEAAQASPDKAAQAASGSPSPNGSDPRVSDYLSRARNALGLGQLIEPAQDNARFYIDSARALAPEDPQVQQAVQDLIARLEEQAHQALAAKNPEAAERFASASAEAGADPAQVAALRDEAQQLRSTAREEALANLTHAFNQSLEQGHVLEPASDSARYYLAQLTQADAGSTATQLARGAYRTRVLAEAGNALRAQDLAGARRWLAEAREAGAGSAEVGTLEAALSAAQDEAAQANTYVNESTLTRTRYVAPQFPDLARQRGIDGWVDLQFLVGIDGTVSDVAVVGAQPVGMFEAAALEAVRHWRYQPVVHDGHTVAQRARVRVRFAVQR